ncbi:hypothetical protein HMPREF1548_03805 [Clostridium sp. KLE 1755]|nr:hypothetical protein HMPREF1548_03805 [Clostridium sp. KLE 1755]
MDNNKTSPYFLYCIYEYTIPFCCFSLKRNHFVILIQYYIHILYSRYAKYICFKTSFQTRKGFVPLRKTCYNDRHKEKAVFTAFPGHPLIIPEEKEVLHEASHISS